MRGLGGARRLLPSLADYRGLRSSWKGDLAAGVTVGVVALPLALAFGVTSGVGAEAGLITAIIAGLVAAVFGGSNVQVSGPTGAMVVVLGPIVMLHGTGAVATVALMAGVLVLLAGLARIGKVIAFIPWPVIEGFTLGIAIIIFLQQVPAAIGSEGGGHPNAVIAAVMAFSGTTALGALPSLAIVALVAALMLLLPKVSTAIPASLVAVAVATAVTVVASIEVARIGALPGGLPGPQLPALSAELVTALVGPAITIAVLAAIESLLSARVAASMSDAGRYDADRELLGQGLASIASGLFGGMPATGAIARTAVNVRAGARTRVAAIIHAVVIILFIYLASTVVSLIPLAALAGILMVTAVRMVSWRALRSVVRASRSDAAVLLVTVVITVAVDLVVAVGLGIAAAAFFALRALAGSGGVSREVLPGAAHAGDDRIALFRIDGALFFGAADRISDEIDRTASVGVVILRLSQVQVMDATGARAMAELVQSLERRGVTVLIKGVQERHLHVATQVGVIAALRDRRHLFHDLGSAVDHARNHIQREVP